MIKRSVLAILNRQETRLLLSFTQDSCSPPGCWIEREQSPTITVFCNGMQMTVSCRVS